MEYWYSDAIVVRKLYRERKFRRCTTTCEDLLKHAVDPVHKIFLLFYQAVCYETLAGVSHDYSSNKVELLEQARDALFNAQENLPSEMAVVCAIASNHTCKTPAYAKLKLLEEYDFDTPSVHTPLATHEPYKSAQRMESQVPRKPITQMTPVNSVSLNKSTLQSPPMYTPALVAHKVRLSQSLSHNHELAEFLVPSPLFSRSGKHSRDTSVVSASIASRSDTKSLPTAARADSTNRPLPALPLQPRANFITIGSKVVLRPKRQTALSTLIAKFDANGPFYFTPPHTIGDREVRERGRSRVRRDYASTPMTARYQRISTIFSEKPPPSRSREQFSIYSDDKNTSDHIFASPSKKTNQTYDARHNLLSDDKENVHNRRNIRLTTPVHPPRRRHLRINYQPPSCAANTRYQEALSNFHSTITRHITNTTTQITTTHNHQKVHQVKKKARKPNKSPNKLLNKDDHRLASFWALSSPPPYPSTSVGRHLTADSAARDDVATLGGTLKSKGNGYARKYVEGRELKERIALLKKGGWKVNAKEKGYKGAQYYDTLISDIAGELDMLGCA